jgi:hypothetical protein
VGGKLLVELRKWDCSIIETIIQQRLLQDLEKEMEDFMQMQHRKFMELDLKVDSIVFLVT